MPEVATVDMATLVAMHMALVRLVNECMELRTVVNRLQQQLAAEPIPSPASEGEESKG